MLVVSCDIRAFLSLVLSFVLVSNQLHLVVAPLANVPCPSSRRCSSKKGQVRAWLPAVEYDGEDVWFFRGLAFAVVIFNQSIVS